MHTITTPALIKRINRRLAKDSEVLRTTRGKHYNSDFESYWIQNTDTGERIAWHVDPKQLGREVGAFKPGEVVAD